MLELPCRSTSSMWTYVYKWNLHNYLASVGLTMATLYWAHVLTIPWRNIEFALLHVLDKNYFLSIHQQLQHSTPFLIPNPNSR